jgi:hypothetical protein
MLNQNTLAEIAELTDDNNHGQALAVAARMLGKSHLADILFDLVGQHDEEGWRLSPATKRPALPVNGKRNEG